MNNIFSKIEDKVFSDEAILFDEEKIRGCILEEISINLNSAPEKEKAFLFEEIVFDFFEYMNMPVIRTKKTRDFGIDGIIKLPMPLFKEINLGVQAKCKIIDSTDIDLFISALRNSEIHLGVIVCKEARKFEKYSLNSKLKAILFSRGIKIKERLINENIDINPVFIMKIDEIINIVASDMRGAIKAIYKQ